MGVSKVDKANLDDATQKANQDAVSVGKSGDVVTIRQIGELTSFVGGDGDHKYVALDIDTGLDSIIGVKWGNYTITQSDEDEATAVGLPNGHIVYYAECDVLQDTPRIITLKKTGLPDYAFSVRFIPSN